MNTTRNILALSTLCILPFTLDATYEATFADPETFSDFSVSGMSEAKTLKVFERELQDFFADLGDKYVPEDQTLSITFHDIDMAGDIQPWRNIHNSDIRYVEAIYPPRLEISYVLKDADGEVISEGRESLSDLAYQMNVAASIRNRYENFFYETTLLKDWIRKSFKPQSSGKS